MGGRAAYYPMGLITAILKGMRNTADAEAKEEQVLPIRLSQATLAAGMVHDVPCTSESKAVESHDLAAEVKKKTFHVQCKDGTKKKVQPNALLQVRIQGRVHWGDSPRASGKCCTR